MGLKRNVSLFTGLRYKGQGSYVDVCPASHRRIGHGDLHHHTYSGIVSGWRMRELS